MIVRFFFNVLKGWQPDDGLPISPHNFTNHKSQKKSGSQITFHLGLQKHFYQFSPSYLKNPKIRNLLLSSPYWWPAILKGKTFFFSLCQVEVCLPPHTHRDVHALASPMPWNNAIIRMEWVKQKTKTKKKTHLFEDIRQLVRQPRLQRSCDGQFYTATLEVTVLVIQSNTNLPVTVKVFGRCD